VAALGSAQSFFDDFNRADGPLGANWQQVSGTDVISNNMAGSTAAANGLALVQSSTFTGAYDLTTVTAIVGLRDQSTALAYTALALGHNGSTAINNGIFVKVQRQSASMFNFIGIYTGAGSNGTGITTAGGNFQALPSQFSRARMTIKMLDPTTLYTGLDTNFDSVDDITYNSTLNFPTLTVGNQVGLHTFGTMGAIDDFNASVVPEPATLAILGLGVAALARRKKRA
jgi:hypothetical protein